MWGLKSDGVFNSRAIRHAGSREPSSRPSANNHGESVYVNITNEMRRVRGVVSDELDQLELSKASDREKESRLLFLFHCDVMPMDSALILDAKRRRDERFAMASLNQVERWEYVLAWVVVAVLVVVWTVYILSFGRRQCSEVQEA